MDVPQGNPTMVVIGIKRTKIYAKGHLQLVEKKVVNVKDNPVPRVHTAVWWSIAVWEWFEQRLSWYERYAA